MINADAARLMATEVNQARAQGDPVEIAQIEQAVKDAASRGEFSASISFALSQGTLDALIARGYDVVYRRLWKQNTTSAVISWN